MAGRLTSRVDLLEGRVSVGCRMVLSCRVLSDRGVRGNTKRQRSGGYGQGHKRCSAMGDMGGGSRLDDWRMRNQRFDLERPAGISIRETQAWCARGHAGITL